MVETRKIDNVISMTRYRESMSHPALAQVEGYWEGLRAGRIMPTRAEIDPRGITGALEFAFVLERVARGIGRFRIAGMHFNDLMGMEVRGMPLTALMTPEAREIAAEGLEAVFDTPAIVRFALEGETGIGRPALRGQMILLPLRSDLGDVTRALGCLVTEGPAGRTPRRFAITDQHRRALTGFGQAPAPAEAPREAAAGFAERPAGFARSAAETRATAPARPHLRLVKSGE